MKICPNCNKEFESGKFCPECGKELVEPATASKTYKKCPNCGTENSLNAKFCEECGTNLEEKMSQSKFVDLGLSVLWATCNLGANNAEEYGDYYAWSETTPKTLFSKSNKVSYPSKDLDSIHDAATSKFGDGVRMPKIEDFNELIEQCTVVRCAQNGGKGYKITGPNHNFIFLPIAGYYDVEDNGRFNGNRLMYWSSSFDLAPCWLDDDDFEYNGENGNTFRVNYNEEYEGYSDGFPIRPVKEK